MGEVYKKRETDDDGLELETPNDEYIDEKPYEKQQISLYDDNGKEIKKDVIFSVRDNINHAAYIFIDNGEDSVLGLVTEIDEEGNPTQDELRVIDEESPYLKYAEIYLEAYNDGSIENIEQVDKKVEELKKSSENN